MKHTQIVEGPEAFERFRRAMKTIVSVPKHIVVQADRKAQKKKKRDHEKHR